MSAAMKSSTSVRAATLATASGSDEAVEPMIVRFLDAVWMERGLSPNTLAAYRADLTALSRWLRKRGTALERTTRNDLLGFIAWRVETPAEIKEYYERFKAQGVPIDHCVSHAYEEMGNTVSCYFLDPEGNCLEVYALVPERDEKRINRPLDLDKSVSEIVAQASGLGASGTH